MSNSIFITGSKEILNTKNLISDSIKNTYDTLDENINIDLDNNIDFSWFIFSKYTIFFIIISILIFFILYNNDITIDYIVKYFVYGSGETIKQTIDTSVKGVKTTLDITESSIDNAVNIIEKSVGIDNDNSNEIELDLNKLNKNLIKKQTINIPEPRETTNTIKKKSGYCYIGEDRGFRSCVKVSQHDTCMSGDIFPSRDICINPNLR
jgi:hypothetical protein